MKTFDQHLNAIEASRCFRFFFLNCRTRPLHDNLFGLKVCHGNIAESVSSDDGIGTSDIRIRAFFWHGLEVHSRWLKSWRFSGKMKKKPISITNIYIEHWFNIYRPVLLFASDRIPQGISIEIR
jgi:hypothetical protein